MKMVIKEVSILTDDERPFVQYGNVPLKKDKMIEQLIEPFNYNYMINAMWVSTLVGIVCAFLSSFLMLKVGLIGDALSHSVVPGVAIAYAIGIPFAFGALFQEVCSEYNAFLSERSGLKVDAVIGIIFTSF